MNTDKTQAAITLAKCFSDFLAHCNGKKSPCTIDGYRTAMRLVAEFAAENLKMEADEFGIGFFTEDNVNAFIMWLKNEHGAKPQSVNLRLSQIRSFLKYLSKSPEYSQYYLAVRRIGKLRTADRSKVVEPLSKEAMKAIAHTPGTETVTGLRYTALITMLYTMACRIDEILSIRLGDLVFDSARPHVTVVGKGSKARTVYLMSRTVAILRKYIMTEHGSKPDTAAYLFFSRSKGLYSKISGRGVNKQLAKYASQARKACKEVPDSVHTHCFRHSMASHCLDDGMNIFQISKMLGHKSVNTTMVYLGVSISTTENAIRKIESTAAGSVKPVWKKTKKLKDLF